MIAVAVISTFAVPVAAFLLVGLARALGWGPFSRTVAVIGGGATAAAGMILLFTATGQADPLRVDAGAWLFVSGPMPVIVTPTLVVDHMAAWLIAVVAFVGGLIVIHAATVSANAPWSRICWMLLSVAATAWLLSCENLLFMIVAWQALMMAMCGLAAGQSAELRRKTAARKTALVLTIGGCGLLAAACGLWSSTGSLGITQILESLSSRDLVGADFVAVTGIVIAATAACAQVPLCVWLPDAGEDAPSAAAALQCIGSGAAGIWLLIAFQPYLNLIPGSLFAVALIGGGTALIAGWIAVNQISRPRLLAYVTISQLGMIWLALGTGVTAGVLAAGMQFAIHAAGMSAACLATGQSRAQRAAYATAAAGLCGFPLFAFSGFWSLSAILSVVRHAAEGTLDGPAASVLSPTGWSTLFWSAVAAILLTTCSLFRLMGASSPREGEIINARGIARVTWIPNGALWLLVTVALVLGAAVGSTTGWLAKFLTPSIPADETDPYVQVVIVAAVVGGIAAAWLLRLASGRSASNITRPFRALGFIGLREFFLPDYYFLGVALPLRAGSLLCRFVDWFVIDRILIGTFARLPLKFAKTAQPLQNGLIQFYALMIVAAVAMILAVVQWSGGGAP